MARGFAVLLLAGALGLGAVQGAAAAPLTALDILRQFNVVVTGDLSINSDIEGRTVLGGTLTGGVTFFNQPGAAAPSDYRALTVYGSSTVTNPINVNNGGGATIAGTAAGPINLNGGGALSVGGAPAAPAPNPMPGFTATFTTPLLELSAQLAALTANSTLPGSSVPGFPNNVPITATDDVGLAVFSISAAELASYASFSLDLNGNQAAVFNVTGSYTGTANFLNATGIARDVIWNFVDATSLDFQRQWGGTVLAPDAVVTNATPIEGMLFAASFDGHGEVHSQPFRGTLPDPPAVVPEPGGLSLLLLCMAGVGLAWVRRTAAA